MNTAMKLNWGHGIILAMGAFMLFIVAMGVVMMYSSTERPEANYYEKDLRYQQSLDAQRNALALRPDIVLEEATRQVVISFAQPLVISRGQIYFRRPDADYQDFTLVLRPNAQGQQRCDVSRLSRGVWKVHIEWQAQDKHYQTPAHSLTIK